MGLRKLTLILALSFFPACLSLRGDNAHLCIEENIPEIVASFTIVDVGETDIDALKLASGFKKLTLSPKINNNGLIIGNTTKGGFLTYPGRWMHHPQFEGMTINFHSLNDQGDLLVAVVRGHESVEWMQWPCRENNYGTQRQHIKTIDPFKDKFFVTGFNNENQVTAYHQSTDCHYKPLEWTLCNGIEKLGAKQDLDIQGAAKGINNRGTVVGIFDSIVDQTPFVWNPCCGLLTMTNYRQSLDPTGWVEFADLHVTEDNVVYGTYWIKHLADTVVTRGHYYETRQSSGSYYQYNAFAWVPSNGLITMLNLQGMRIAGVNCEHVLVGSLQDHAMICFPGREPVQLASLMEPDEVKDWKLLEITDINDQGQVVGYGWYKDKMHIFLANPLR